MDLLAQSLCLTLLWFPASACTALGDGPHRPLVPLARSEGLTAEDRTTDVPRPSPERVDVALQAITAPAGDCNSPMILAEFFPDPSRVPDGVGEYLELYNPGATPVRLNGWRLTDLRRDSHVLSSEAPLVVAPGGVFVVGPELDERANGNVAIDYRYDRFHLSNKSDRIRLEDACGAVVFDVVYPTDPGLPEVRAGRSIELTRLAGPGKAAGWQQSRTKMRRGDHGTPGKVPFSTGDPVVKQPPSGAAAKDRQEPVVERTVGRNNSLEGRARPVEHKP
jgi:hypothetical protein